jgi:hypothetical protein
MIVRAVSWLPVSIASTMPIFRPAYSASPAKKPVGEGEIALVGVAF